MLRKLYNKLTSLMSQSDATFSKEDKQQLMEDFKEYKHEKEHQLASSGVAEKIDKKEEQIQVDLDTGKIIFPDSMTKEEKEEVEAALKELQESLQNLTKDQFQSLEEYLASPKSGSGTVVPFITVNKLPDAQFQVAEEMENHKEDTEHYSSDDYLDVILSYHNQGYEFDGFEEMYNKVAQKIELSKEDRKTLEQWYLLVSMELVYDV